MEVLTIDDVLDEELFAGYRDLAGKCRYQQFHYPEGRETSSAAPVGCDNQVCEQLSASLGSAISPSVAYLKRFESDADESCAIHSDQRIADYVAIIPLGAGDGDGVALWRRKADGRPWPAETDDLDEVEIVSPDQAGDWEEYDFHGDVANRAVVFPARLYHAQRLAARPADPNRTLLILYFHLGGPGAERERPMGHGVLC